MHDDAPISTRPSPWRLRSRELALLLLGLAVGLGGQSLLPQTGGPEAQAAAVAEPVAGDARTDRQRAQRVAYAAPSSAEPKAVPLPTKPAPALNQQTHRSPSFSRGQRLTQTAFNSTVFVEAGGSYGAGLVVSTTGHVLTCWHVVKDHADIDIVLADGQQYRARLVDHDKRLDLAVVVIEGALPQLQPAPLASVTSVAPTQEVYAVGAPHRMSFSLHRGIVSFVGRPFDGVLYLQTDIATNGGNSGGPVLNERGEVIALSSFILRGTQGLAFAVPVDYAMRRFADYFTDNRFDEVSFNEWLSSNGNSRRAVVHR